MSDYRGCGAAWAIEFAQSAGGREAANNLAKELLEDWAVLVLTTGSPAGNVVALCPPVIAPTRVVRDVLGFIVETVARDSGKSVASG